MPFKPLDINVELCFFAFTSVATQHCFLFLSKEFIPWVQFIPEQGRLQATVFISVKLLYY